MEKQFNSEFYRKIQFFTFVEILCGNVEAFTLILNFQELC